MIHDLKRYREYEDHGVSWIGEVPRHWKVLPTRGLFTEVKERDHPDEEMLSVTITKGVIRQRALLADSSKKDSSNLDKTAYKLVQPGDIAYNKMRAWQGAVGTSEYRGIVSPAYVVIRPRENQNPRYFHYLLRTPAFAKEAERWSYGIASDMWSLRPEHFKMIYCACPPPEEQAAIVRFLDYADRRIRRYIRAKQKLIAFLNEQRQSIVFETITRGLDPNPRLHALGSSPAFEVNARWQRPRLWRISRIRSEKNRPELDLLSVFLGRGVIPYGQGGGQVHKPSLDLAGYQVVYAGDLVLNNQQAWRGSVGISKYHGIISPAYVVMDMTDVLDSRFADYLFQSRVMVSQFVTSSKGVGDIQRDIHMPWLKNVRVPLPSLEEQKAMATALDYDLAAVDRQLSIYEREISLLLEYHTRLIADVVTGKLDVREAATRLPEEVVEPQPKEESEPVDEATEEIVDEPTPEESEV